MLYTDSELFDIYMKATDKASELKRLASLTESTEEEIKHRLDKFQDMKYNSLTNGKTVMYTPSFKEKMKKCINDGLSAQVAYEHLGRVGSINTFKTVYSKLKNEMGLGRARTSYSDAFKQNVKKYIRLGKPMEEIAELMGVDKSDEKAMSSFVQMFRRVKNSHEEELPVTVLHSIAKSGANVSDLEDKIGTSGAVISENDKDKIDSELKNEEREKKLMETSLSAKPYETKDSDDYIATLRSMISKRRKELKALEYAYGVLKGGSQN